MIKLCCSILTRRPYFTKLVIAAQNLQIIMAIKQPWTPLLDFDKKIFVAVKPSNKSSNCKIGIHRRTVTKPLA